MDLLTVSRIRKQQGASIILKDVSLTQQRFQKIAVAGETGSGKSTLLKIIAGLVQPDAGEVLFENVRVKGPAEKLIPGHASIAYLSQHFELRNNYTIEEELNYTNKLSDEEAATIFETCRIAQLLKRRTDQVSGGEKQRISIARLLISSPKLLLLDEPYSNLDMIHKNILKTVIREIGERLNITCMLVSHEPMEILSWAHKIIVLKEGVIIQEGSPEKIYRQPVNEYVAALFGGYNLISNEQTKKLFASDNFEVDGKDLFIRPENFKITDDGTQSFKGIVKNVVFLGGFYEIEVCINDVLITVKTSKSNIDKGDEIYLSLSADEAWYL